MPTGHVVTVVVCAYAVLVVALSLAVAGLTDRALLVTLVAYGPRWLAALPVVPLGVAAVYATSARVRRWLLATLALTTGVLILGLLDFRLGLHRASGPRELRLLIQNLGESDVTAEAFDRLLRSEHVDIAAIQECPFYDNGPVRLGWRFFYGGDLCLVSRFPFTVRGVADPDNAWRRADRDPMQFAVEAPPGPFTILNVHFATIRHGLDALSTDGWRALPRFAANRQLTFRESTSARERARLVDEPLLVVGDFNLPVESAIYRGTWSDFENAFSRCGRGFGHTKFTKAFGIRIDHVLTSKHWECVDARVLPSPYGGDHAPLLVDLRLRHNS